MSSRNYIKPVTGEICTPIQLKPASAPCGYMSPLSLAPVLECPKAPRMKALRPVGHVLPPMVLEPYFISHL